MKKNVLSKSLFTATFILSVCAASFAQVGGAGGDKAPARLSDEKQTVVVGLSDMLVATEGSAAVETAQPAAAPKRKAFGWLRTGSEKSGAK